MKLGCESAYCTGTNNDGVVWVQKGLKIEDKASGCQVPLVEKSQSKLYHYAVNFEKSQHSEGSSPRLAARSQK